MLKIKDLDLLKNLDILFENEIILYGAGGYGRKACQLLKRIKAPIAGFCDSNVTKWGEVIEDYRVLSLYEMLDMVKEKAHIIIVIAMANPNDVEQVLGVLEKNGVTGIDCYTYFALKHTVELHIDDDRIEEEFRREEKRKKELYCELYAIYHRDTFSLAVLWNIEQKRNEILILQSGKVGSSSVRNSLKKAQVPCFHVHTLSGQWGAKKFDKTKNFLPLPKTEKIRMISLVRDPIARGLAVYFQSFHEYIMRTYADSFEPDSCKGAVSILRGETENGTYGAMFEWFNLEIRDVFGVDVYQHDFDREKGYQIIRQDNVELLLIKLEKLNDCEEVIGQFAGTENFKLIRTNDANDKLYRFAYEDLKRTIEIPQDILDFYYKDNPAMDHFYTAQEKERFYQKWKK